MAEGKISSNLKKVLIVANTTWNIYNFRMGILRKLVREGCEVVVVAPVDNYIHYLEQLPSVRHLPLKYLSPQSKNPFQNLLLFWELFRLYRTEKPDIIFHFTIKPNIFGSLAARKAGIRSVPTVTGLGYTFLHGRWLNNLTIRLYRWAFSGLERVVFHNQDDSRLFIDNEIISPAQALVVAGSGVNTNFFRPLPKPYTEKKFRFLFIGRLLYDKGVKEYVEAAAAVQQKAPYVECQIVGDLATGNPNAIPKGEFLEWLKQKYIRYFGAASDVRPFIKQCDVLVLPSYREGMPRAILEAMAMGRPIITTDVAGCREAICPKTGCLVPVGDSKALAEAMLAFCHKEPESLEAMGHAARRRALRVFDERLVVNTYYRLSESQPVETTIPVPDEQPARVQLLSTP